MSRRHNVEQSRHHIFFEARNYDHEWLREVRERNIVLMRHIGHIGLHKAVEPPPVPTLEMAADYLDAYDITKPNRGMESVEFTREYFADSYVHYIGVDEKQDIMLGIANNISRQMPWIIGNLVE